MSVDIYGNRDEGFSGSYQLETNDVDKLKNCPFCGERHDLEINNTHSPAYWVSCNNCGAEMHPAMPRFGVFRTEKGAMTGHKRALEAAISGWNLRAEKP